MKQVLVTGASGFIGTHLSKALAARGDQVSCLVRSTSNTELLKPLGVQFVEGDVTQPERLAAAVANVDVVFHLAGKVTARRSAELESVNAKGTENVVEACAKSASPPLLVYVSSMAASGPTRRNKVRQESEPPNPVSNYGRSKLAGEDAVEQRAGELPISIVRPSIVFGPGDRVTLKMFQPIASFGVHPVVGFGSTKLALIHVDDVVDLIMRTADNGQRLPAPDESPEELGRGVYFAAGDEFPNYRELGRMMAGALDRGVIMLPAPPPLPWILAGMNQWAARLMGRAPALSIDKIREASVASWACSSEKAQRELGFKSSKPLADHFRDTAQWYLENGWLKIRFAPFRRRTAE